MAHLVTACPHCNAEKIGFAPVGCIPMRYNSPRILTFLQCQGCGEGIIVTFEGGLHGVQAWMGTNSALPKIIHQYPYPQKMTAPDSVPDQVAAAYLSGVDNLERKNGANAAVAMFRRAIELAARTKDPDAPKKLNLEQRINRLPDDMATPAMKKWAHHIRLSANEAVHEPEEFSEEEAKELKIFAELFLTYAFSLPAMLPATAAESGDASPMSGAQK